jgi:hypothetical protein
VFLDKDRTMEIVQKHNIYNNLEVLQQLVGNACQEIQLKPGIFDRMGTSVRKRAESCVETHGNHTEHLL